MFDRKSHPMACTSGTLQRCSNQLWMGFAPSKTAFIILVLATLLHAHPAHCAPVARLQTITNSASVLHSDTTQPLVGQEGDRLSEGDTVQTLATGKCTILFDDGSQILVDSSTQIVLSPEASVQGSYQLIRIIHGTILARLRPGASIVSASATAKVRGTEFAMTVDAEDVTRVAVIEGSVCVFSMRRAQSQYCQTQQSSARPGQAPTGPVTTSANGLLLEWTVDLSRAIVPREQFYGALNQTSVQQTVAQTAAALMATPTLDTAHIAYGRALFDAHRYADALVQYQETAKITPVAPNLTLYIADTLYALDRLDEAQSRYEAIIASSTGVNQIPQQSSSSSSDIATAYVGLAWVELHRDQPELAQVDAQHAVDREPNADALIVLGVSQMRRIGSNATLRDDLRLQAKQNLTAALAARPLDLSYQAHAWLSALLLSENDLAGSLTEAQDAVQNQPNSSLAHGQLALTMFFSGDVRRSTFLMRTSDCRAPRSGFGCGANCVRRSATCRWQC